MARIIDLDDPRDRALRVGPSYYDSPESSGIGFAGGIALMFLFVILLMVVLSNERWSQPSIRTQFAPAPVVTASYSEPVTTPATGIGTVVADELKLRVKPNNYSRVTYILPRGTQVMLLGEEHYEFDGDTWLRVSVDTVEGRQEGWVSRQFVA